jgi:hypothetical protein
MDLATVAVIAVAAWLAVVVVVIAMCTAASRSDAQSERLFLLLR